MHFAIMVTGLSVTELPDLEVQGDARRGQDGRFSFLKQRLAPSSLAFQFLAVGGFVSLLAMLLVGLVVTTLIEKAITRNAAATTALYVDSVIAPLLPDLRQGTTLDDIVRRALDETLSQGALGRRLIDMRIWSLDGELLYASNQELTGKRYPISSGLAEAAAGEVVANYDRFDQIDDASATPPGPVLEIYNPILQPWSGDVVAVSEFYERASDLQAMLNGALIRSWAAIAVVTCLFFAALSALVFRGSRTIDRQASDLNARVRELTALLAQNQSLQIRIQRATQHATTLNERYLRRLGADLHDGPAQFVALAAMRLDSQSISAPSGDPELRQNEIQGIRSNLTEALDEIRAICQGLVLPQIENSTIGEVVLHAISVYERQTGAVVIRPACSIDSPVPLSQRICAYRFVQEALTNGFRHCPGARQQVAVEVTAGKLSIFVEDDGPGFDPNAVSRESIGIAGLRERIESLGGTFLLNTSPNGTLLTMVLETSAEGEG